MRVSLGMIVVLVAACGGKTASDPLSVDAATDSAHAADTNKTDTPFVCVDEMGRMPIALKTCTNNSDCMMRERQSDCCGSRVLVGVRADVAAAFAACEAERQKGLPLCDCIAQPTVAEDGRETSGRFPIVRCTDFTSSGGICKTFVE